MQATLATSQSTWLRSVEAWINDLDMRSDGRENIRKIARIVGFHADWKTLTTNTLTWSIIMERTGMSRATVARHLRTLHEAGWIGRVAAGRSAAAKQAAGWTGDDAFINDAPVYALTQTIDDAVVDINETPPTVSGYKEFPARARAEETPPGAASRPSPTKEAGGRRHTVPADRTPPAWSSHETTSSKNERILASCEWARRVPALNKLSDRHLAFLAKDFFVAGWTVRDLMTALDTRPNGWKQGKFVDGQWVPFSGADGIPATRLGHWVNWRLNAWRDNGVVVESPTQTRTRRAAAAEIQRKAEQRARDEERLRNQAEMATPEGQAAKQACLAQFASRSKHRIRRR